VQRGPQPALPPGTPHPGPAQPAAWLPPQSPLWWPPCPPSRHMWWAPPCGRWGRRQALLRAGPAVSRKRQAFRGEQQQLLGSFTSARPQDKIPVLRKPLGKGSSRALESFQVAGPKNASSVFERGAGDADQAGQQGSGRRTGKRRASPSERTREAEGQLQLSQPQYLGRA
jgi:hypothetical protein